MDDVFERLSGIMRECAGHWTVSTDEPGSLSIETTDEMANGKLRWFGGVATKKNYVSYHLMPVYERPELLDDISPELRTRMQGKSCFNFKQIDEQLFSELADLTSASVADFVERHDLD